MHLWRYPSLSIHGVEGAFDKPGAKTVIPGRVIGKFSIRLVPHMNTSVVEKQVTSAHGSLPGSTISEHRTHSVISVQVSVFFFPIQKIGINGKKLI